MAATIERMSEPWPLTGRHEEIDAARSALVDDGTPAYFLVGAPGTGKTRVAREILTRVEADGRATARVNATESAALTPLAAVAHLVPVGATDDPPSLFHATSAALRPNADTSPLVLHVDDAHHLDSSSATLLAQLCDTGVAQLLVCMRVGVTTPDAITRLQSRDGARAVSVDALDPIATDTLLHRVLAAPLDGAAEAQLLATSGGNPLFLRELVLGAVADGTLREIDGVWRLDGARPTGR